MENVVAADRTKVWTYYHRISLWAYQTNNQHLTCLSVLQKQMSIRNKDPFLSNKSFSYSLFEWRDVYRLVSSYFSFPFLLLLEQLPSQSETYSYIQAEFREEIDEIIKTLSVPLWVYHTALPLQIWYLNSHVINLLSTDPPQPCQFVTSPKSFPLDYLTYVYLWTYFTHHSVSELCFLFR